ncbi:MAG: PQQ-dependent sugar dehydrogenase, partial [Caldilineales bacterium]|nr:PQQ-dependent sugar dehydrogenase [Caldilineales bacterium]
MTPHPHRPPTVLRTLRRLWQAATTRRCPFLWAAPMLLAALAACGGSPETPTPLPTLPLPPIVAVASPTATATATPSPTALPTLVPTPTEALPSPTGSLPPPSTETPTPLPTATPTAMPSPTPTPSPRPTATPTPLPAVDLGQLSLGLEKRVEGLQQPVFATHAGDGSRRLFVVERPGRIWVVEPATGSRLVFLDIQARVGSSASEQGLLGLAFHPRFAQNGWLFVYYTDREGDTVISRFQAIPDRTAADPSSEAVLLRQVQPADNHNGGMIAFGPDGMLYAGLGDGGSAGDPWNNAQRLDTLLGKLLRLYVDAESGYAAPADNPFVGSANARPEIWAYGLRNPWRFSFDRVTGDLYIGDVGQNRWEEINFLPAGSRGGVNYGWKVMEGSHCYNAEACDRGGLTLPVAEYDHEQGCSVTGGYVYRG